MKKQLLLSALLLNIPILISSAGFTIQNNTDKTIWVASTLHLPLKDQRLSEKPGTKTKQKVDTKELEVDGKKLLFIEVPSNRQEFIITKAGDRKPYWLADDKQDTLYTTKENSFKNPDLLVIGKKNKAVNNYYLKEAVLGVTKKEHSGNAIEKGIKQEAPKKPEASKKPESEKKPSTSEQKKSKDQFEQTQKEELMFSNMDEKDIWHNFKDSLYKLENSGYKKSIYDILEIKKDAKESDIPKAYRKAMFKYHPDKAADNNLTDEQATTLSVYLNEIKSVLTNKNLRKFYDENYLSKYKK